MSKNVYIYSPSGAVRDKNAFKRGLKRLSQLGYNVEVDTGSLLSSTRFAGDDEQRAQAFSRAADSGADVALISRGGYGITRILDILPYEKIAASIENGTKFVGISDFTAFQAAIYAKCKSVTWAGPALCEGFGSVENDGLPDDIMEDCFYDLISGQGEGTGWRQDRNAHYVESDQTLATDALVWGGNLCVLSGLLGTPYFPAIKNGILFLEDVGEHPYRVERMLSQLLYTGVLSQQRAIILGQFTGFKLNSHDRGFSMKVVVEWLRSKTNVPVITNLPYGHVQTKVVLPFGKSAELAVHSKDVMLFWGH